MRRLSWRRNLAALLNAVLILGITLDQGRAGVAAPPEQPPEQNLGTVSTITLPWTGIVETSVVAAESEVNVTQYELRIPAPTQTVCTDCAPGHARSLGRFNAGTQLVFYLVDRTYNQTYASTDASHARIDYLGSGVWLIEWDDAGYNNVPDRDFDDLKTIVAMGGHGSYAMYAASGARSTSATRRSAAETPSTRAAASTRARPRTSRCPAEAWVSTSAAPTTPRPVRSPVRSARAGPTRTPRA